jgi:hypothetical protein
MPRLTKPPRYIGKRVVNSSGMYMQEGDRLIINVMQNFTKPPTAKVWKEGGKILLNINAKWYKTTKVLKGV